MAASRAFVSGALCALALLLSGATAQAGIGEWQFSSVPGADGVPLSVVETGTRGKPGILFMHGYGQSSLSWDAQLRDDELQRNFHLVAFDLRGHGASGKPWRTEDYSSAAWAGDVAAVIEATGLQRPVIVAWSFGGNVAMHYVREYGIAHIAAIQFVGTVGRLTDFVTPPEPADPDWIADVLSPDMRANMRAARSGVGRLTAAEMPEEWVAQAMWVSATLPNYAKSAIGYGDEDNSDLAAKLNLPVRFVTGEFDRLVTPATIRGAVSALPDATAYVYSGVGHSPFIESSAAFNRDLLRFLRRAADTP